MSRLQQYLFFGGLLALFRWTPLGRLLQSDSFINVVSGVIVVLLAVAVFVVFPQIKKKQQRRNSFRDDEKD